MVRARLWRRGVGLAAATVIAVQLFAGTAGAADTRLLAVTWTGNTQVTAGGVTAATVTVANNDNQNLSHVRLGIGTTPASGGLPAGVSIVNVIGADATFCSWTSSQVSCDFDSIARRKARTLQVLFGAQTAGSLTVPVAASVNEGGNPNGTNQQVFPADLPLAVQTATCDLAATYFAPGQAGKVLGTDSCALSAGNPQSTKVSVPDGIVSAVVVREDATAVCQTGFTCFGQLSVGDFATDGSYLVTWTIQWTVASNFNVNKFGIIHFNDNGSFDFALTNKNQNYCKNANSGDCIVSLNLTGTTLTGVFRTVGNGSMRGFN